VFQCENENEDEEGDEIYYLIGNSDDLESDEPECEKVWYKNEGGEKVCLEQESCPSNENYFYHTDTKECKKDNCNDGYLKFNFECYKDNCPQTEIMEKNEDKMSCECKYKYYIDNDGKIECLENGKKCEQTEYKIESDINQCFESKQDCFDKNGNNKFFNNICYTKSCPENSNDNDNDRICKCTYNYFYDKSNLKYICLTENEKCEDKGYNYESEDRKECYTSIEDCKQKEKKIFNNICYVSCPTPNTEEKDNDGICHCKFNYYYSSQEYICLNENEECLSKTEYKYKSPDGKICYKNEEECSGKKIFNNICYDSCPSNTE